MRKSMTFIAAALLAMAGSAASASQIGTVAAVNTDVEGTPPAGATRVLRLTDQVVQDELIVSSPVGSAQLLFLDQTSLTVSPNSRIVLDSYVYDPATGTGEIAVAMTQGVLRFIGGRVTKGADATIRTPVATVGIRGGIGLYMITEDLVRIVHVAGDYTRASCDGSTACSGPPVTVTRPNALIEVRAGEAPRYAGIASPAVIGEFLSSIGGSGNGGARDPGAFAAAFGGQGDQAVQTGGDAPYTNPISTSGESNVGASTMTLDPASSETEFRTLAFSDPQFLGGLAPGGGFVDVGGDGTVRGQLIWRNDSDLDLFLFLPDNAGTVAFFNPTVVFNDGLATAALDADNLGGVINVPPDQRVENITVNGVIPPGSYEFLVDVFSARNNPLTPFTLTLTPDGGITTQVITGELGPGQDSGRIPVIVGPGL